MGGYAIGRKMVTFPYVARIADFGVTMDHEYLVCDLLNGRQVNVFLANTSLEGWVLSRLALEAEGWSTMNSWAEFGERNNHKHYIELLYQSHEFDMLPVHAYHKRAQPGDEYEKWKELHKVPRKLCGDLPLYYAEV